MNKGLHRFYFWLLVGLALLAYYPLVVKHYSWSFSPGSEGNIQVIRQCYNFIEHPLSATIPTVLGSTRTYLNGPFLIAGVLAHPVHFMARQGWLPATVLANNDSLFIFTFRYLSLLLYALSVGVVYLLLRYKLSPTTAFLLTGSAVLFNSVALTMSFMQVDFYLLFSSILFLYTLIRIFHYPHQKINYVFFGVAFVLSAATKLNTPLFLHLPATAILLYCIRHSLTRANALLFLLTVFLVSLVFFTGWYVHPHRIPSYLSMIMEEGKLWFTLAEKAPLHFFHLQIFIRPLLNYWQGATVPLVIFLFIGVGYVVSVLVALGWLVYQYRQTFYAPAYALFAVFVVYSLGIMWGPQFFRYGYLMPFFYVLISGFALHKLNQLGQHQRYRAALAFWVVVPALFTGHNYYRQTEVVRQARISFEQVKLQPRQWILQQVKPGARIALTDVYFSPPLNDINADLSPAFLQVPWGSAQLIINKLPPEKPALDTLTDIVLLSNEDMQRAKFIEPLILKNYNPAPDILLFNRFAAQLEKEMPGAAGRLSKAYGRAFTRESFYQNLLSVMWLQQARLEPALRLYFQPACSNDSMCRQLSNLAGRVLFKQDTVLLQSGYTAFIQAQGGLLPIYAWQAFYAGLIGHYPHRYFEAPAEYYSVKEQYIVIINKQCLKT